MSEVIENRCSYNRAKTLDISYSIILSLYLITLLNNTESKEKIEFFIHSVLIRAFSIWFLFKSHI